MPLSLVLGLASVAGAIGLGCAAALSRAKVQDTHPGVASIEQIYARDIGGGQDAAWRAATLTGPLVGLRGLAAKLSPANVLTRLQHRLDIAGNPGSWTAERVLAFKGLGLVCLGILGLLVGLRSPALLLILPLTGAAAGFFLPDVLVYNAGLKRQERIQRALPDALDMMTVCVEAGLGFDASMAQVARNTEGPLAAEYARVLQEMQFGKSRVQALRAMTERTTVTELRTFVAALVQASDLGIPVAAVLREQAHEMRIRRRQRGEEQAQKVTVKILFPLIFCLFPALMIVVIGPGALNIMHMFSATR
ncbi:MAG: tight adherence protein [Pseudonocardiales bacterium]|jgi:tight adherence protein C|nr:tight adherence protein [Pseudonocardiales bacterium]